MRLLTQHRYENVKQQLRQVRDNLVRLVEDRDFELTIDDTAVCENAQTGSLFRIVLRDCRLRMAETLMTDFYILPLEESAHIVVVKRIEVRAKLTNMTRELTEAGKVDIAVKTCEYLKNLDGKDVLPDSEAAVAKLTEKTAESFSLLLPRSATEPEVRKWQDAT